MALSAEDQAGRDRLKTLKHVVVVMMENRSFDHMLGYLKRDGMADVDGLAGNEWNLDKKGRRIAVTPFDAEAHSIQPRGEALQKRLDPDHSPKGVRIQLGPGYADKGHNKGFVRSFIESRKPEDKVGENLWMVPMGYYTGKDVPVYDHFARQYCVCDSWYSSIPGDTWPNRMSSLAGTYGARITEGDPILNRLTKVGPLKRIRGMPLFDVPAFTRQLKDKQWRWYSHDPASLRLVDSDYRDLGNLKRDNFAFFDRRKVDWLTEALEHAIVGGGSFLDDAARGALPQVSWIDPNFVDASVRETNSNDDHPPSDIRAGQAFVFDVYEALLRSRDWRDTLLVVTYDEHGGFHDHVLPPQLPAGDEFATKHRTYGVRVPALIVGPRVRRGPLHAPSPIDGRLPREQPQYDHTTLIKTILLAFAETDAAAEAALKKMPARVQRAPHLGGLLVGQARKDIDDPRNARELLDRWRTAARQRRTVSAVASDAGVPEPGKGKASRAPDGAGHPLVLTDFQAEWHKFARALRSLGVDA
jgi:phospholipase C